MFESFPESDRFHDPAAWLPGLSPDLLVAAGSAARSRSCFFSTADLREAHQQMNSAFWPHDWRCDTRGGAFECMHFWLDLPSSRISFVRYNRDVWVETPPSKQAVVFQFSAFGQCRLSQGGPLHMVSPGQFFVADPSRPFRQHLPAGYCQMIVSTKVDVLRRHLLNATGDVPIDLEFSDRPLQLEGRGTSVAGLLGHLLWQTTQGAPITDCSAVSAALDQAVIAGLLYALPGPHQGIMHQPATVSALPYYVRRADQFIRENAARALTQDEIVGIAGVSARTLHYGFNRFLDCSPMAYVKQVRLRMARERLLAASDRAASVTAIAMECGFSHLSKFARDYRTSYGESPSETLRRALH